MTTYVLKADRFQHITREGDRIKFIRTYSKGDKIEDLPQGEVDRLLNAGAIEKAEPIRAGGDSGGGTGEPKKEGGGGNATPKPEPTSAPAPSKQEGPRKG